MIGLTWLKFGFIDALPWLVWRTGSIPGMKLARDTYLSKQGTEEWDSMPFVATRFFEIGSEMDGHCLTYLETGECPLPLATLRAKYDLCPWDEIHSEGIHRDARRILKHGEASGTIHMAHHVRQAQNLRHYDSAGRMEQKAWHQSFDRPTALIGIGDRLLRDSLGTRITAKSFPQFVYRMGNMSVGDWKAYNKILGGSRTINKSAGHSDTLQAIKSNFFDNALMNGDVISMPCNDQPFNPVTAATGELSSVPFVNDGTAARSFFFLGREVVSCKL